MYSCDYNGWADVPEEEREGIDAFEAGRLPALSVALTRIPPAVLPVQVAPPHFTHRKAA